MFSSMKEPVFTLTSVYSLLGVASFLLVALVGQKRLLSPHARGWDRFAFTWAVFDGLTHFIYEGAFLYLSTISEAGTVNGSSGPFADLWKEYTKADARWGVSESTVVSLELLTVLGGGPLCMYIAYQVVHNDLTRHYWIIVLSTAELYGGWMTFCPEWLTGSPNLKGPQDSFLLFWVYLVFMNVIWVIVPVALMYDSYRAIATAFRDSQPVATRTRSKIGKAE